MYKYLQITPNMQEMMVMITSLPTCAIVLDRHAKLIEINRPALEFLGIDNVNNYRFKRWVVLNGYKKIQRIIKKLNAGNVVRDPIFYVKSPENNYVIVSFSACMLNGMSKVYIFQFFELSDSLNIFMKSQNSISQLSVFFLREICNNEPSNVTHSFRPVLKNKKQEFQLFADENKLRILSKLISRKYPNFSNEHVFICLLIALGISTDQIGTITHKKVSYLYGVITQLRKKCGFESRREFDAMLTGIYDKI